MQIHWIRIDKESVFFELTQTQMGSFAMVTQIHFVLHSFIQCLNLVHTSHKKGMNVHVCVCVEKAMV